MQTTPPLVLTLLADDNAFDFFDGLRRAHFPPERNFLPAHITLFHHLPGDQEPSIRETLQTVCEQTEVLRLNFPNVRFLGRGVAVAVDCPELVLLRRRLAAVWDGWLGRQDRQTYLPHVTIQNKVEPEEARRLYGRLSAGWEGFAGRGRGLLLWRYVGGPWELSAEFRFRE